MIRHVITASIDDVPELVELINCAYRGETSKKGWTTEANLLDGVRTDGESLTGILQAEGSVMLKHTDENGKIIGCVHLQKMPKKIYLGMLSVHPQRQAKGFGKTLLTAAEQYAKAEGFDEIEMTVITVRTELIDWYMRHGYSKTGETKPFEDNKRFGVPKQPLEFFVMRKHLK